MRSAVEITMKKNIDIYSVAIIILLASAGVLSSSLKTFVAPYLSNPAPMSRFSSLDVAIVAAGARRFASDIAWIQLLQYVGTDEEYEKLNPQEKFLLEYASSKLLFGLDFLDSQKAAALKGTLSARRGSPSTNTPSPDDKYKRHPDVYNMALRVIRMDPHFKYAYLFAGGALAWNYERVDEALAILREGISHNPDYWQFHLYVSAIIYKQNLKDDEMLALLEQAIRDRNAPNMVRVIVANNYEKRGRTADALRVWLDIVETKDPMYLEKGIEKIDRFSSALGFPNSR